MRTARRSSSAYDGLFSAFRAFLARRAQELTGLCLIAAAGAVAVALGTWSVDDPSLNNATDLPVRNLLGWPGAIVADLLMQLLGLGAIAAVLPLALWGWRLMKSGDLGRLQLRLALWVIGAGAATALASALPPTQSWPLPTGLGGVVGDAILAGAKAITGLSSGAASAVLGFLFAGIAILTLTAACGLGPAEGRRHEEPEELDEPLPASAPQDPGLGRGGGDRPRRARLGHRLARGACPWPHEPARQRPPLEGRPPAGRRRGLRDRTRTAKASLAPARAAPRAGARRRPAAPAPRAVLRADARRGRGRLGRGRAAARPVRPPGPNRPRRASDRPMRRRSPASAWPARRSPRCSTKRITSCRS